MSYSQNNEEQIILKYFKDKPEGTFLDLGAFDGVRLSNTRALAEKGWSGILVDASPTVFKQLSDNYKGNTKCICLNVALSQNTGTQRFYDNAEAAGTLIPAQVDRWKDKGLQFKEEAVHGYTWSDFAFKYMQLFNGKYDFISIDIEGADYYILKQIDLDLYGTSMVCVEWNSGNREKFENYFAKYSMKLIHENAENLIFAK